MKHCVCKIFQPLEEENRQQTVGNKKSIYSITQIKTLLTSFYGIT